MRVRLSLVVLMGLLLHGRFADAADLTSVAAPGFVGDLLFKPQFNEPQNWYRAYDTTGNLAWSGGAALPAVSKDLISCCDTIHRPEFANDGYFGNGSSWIGESLTTWLKIDLGESALFDSVAFGRDRLGGYDDRDPGRFRVYTAATDNVYANGDDSDDELEYTLAFDSEAVGFGGFISGPDTQRAMFDSAVNARYVKLSFESVPFSTLAAIDEVDVRYTGTVVPLSERGPYLFWTVGGNVYRAPVGAALEGAGPIQAGVGTILSTSGGHTDLAVGRYGRMYASSPLGVTMFLADGTSRGVVAGADGQDLDVFDGNFGRLEMHVDYPGSPGGAELDGTVVKYVFTGEPLPTSQVVEIGREPRSVSVARLPYPKSASAIPVWRDVQEGAILARSRSEQGIEVTSRLMDGLVGIGDLTVVGEREVYWVEGGSTIRHGTLDGSPGNLTLSGISVVADSLVNVTALGDLDGHVGWIDSGTGKIQRLSNGSVQDLVAGVGEATGLALLKTYRPLRSIVEGEVVLDGSEDAIEAAGTTWIKPDARLTIRGGALQTGSLIADGSLEFLSGSVVIDDDLYVGPGGPLGGSLTLRDGMSLSVRGSLTIAAGSSVTVSGGNLEAQFLYGDGTVDVQQGSIRWGGLTSGVTTTIFDVDEALDRLRVKRDLASISDRWDLGQLDVVVSDLVPFEIQSGEFRFKSILVEGELFVTSGGKLTLESILGTQGTFTVRAEDLAVVAIDYVAGSLVNESGVVAPGASPGATEVTGDFFQGREGVLVIEIAGGIEGETFDQLRVGGAAYLDGTLKVSLLDGFVPGSSDQFRIIAAAACEGAFRNVVNGWLPVGGGRFRVTHDLTGVVLSEFTSVPEPRSAIGLAIGAIGLIGMRRHREVGFTRP